MPREREAVRACRLRREGRSGDEQLRPSIRIRSATGNAGSGAHQFPAWTWLVYARRRRGRAARASAGDASVLISGPGRVTQPERGSGVDRARRPRPRGRLREHEPAAPSTSPCDALRSATSHAGAPATVVAVACRRRRDGRRAARSARGSRPRVGAAPSAAAAVAGVDGVAARRATGAHAPTAPASEQRDQNVLRIGHRARAREQGSAGTLGRRESGRQAERREAD